MYQVQLICNSLYNVEVASKKAYNLLYVATYPKSDKRFIFTLGAMISGLVMAAKAVSWISSGVIGNLKNSGSVQS